jgi:hypothetical protein
VRSHPLRLLILAAGLFALLAAPAEAQQSRVGPPATQRTLGPPPWAEGNWRYGEFPERREGVEVTRVLQLRAENDIPSSLRSQQVRPTLQVFCADGRVGFAVVFGRFIIAGTYANAHPVSYRLDDQPPAFASWAVSPTNRALGRWDDGVRFVAALAGARRLVIEAQPWSEAPVVIEFDVTGLQEAFDRRLGAHCSLVPPPEPEPPPAPRPRRR